MLSKELIEEFRVLMREQYNLDLSLADATRLGEWLVAYYHTLAQAERAIKQAHRDQRDHKQK